LFDTSFIDSWNKDLERENEEKVGQSYELPPGVLCLPLRGQRAMELPFLGTGGFSQEAF